MTGTDTGDPGFHWTGPAERETASEVRRAIRGWAAQAGLPIDVADELTLASYEAIANVVEHAYADSQPGRLSIRISQDADDVVVVVSDQGRWRTSPRTGRDAGQGGSAVQEPGGRGLVLMEGLAKELTVSRTDTGTTVEMRWATGVLQPDLSLPAEVVLAAARKIDPSGAGTTDARDIETRLRGIAAITDPALTRMDIEAMTDEMLARVRELLSVDTVTVLVSDPASSDLIATASLGIEEEVRQGVRIPYGHGFAGTIAATRTPLVLDHVDPTTVLNPRLWEAGLQTLLGVPMVSGAEVIGVLHVGARGPRAFSAQDVNLLELAADRLALATQAHIVRTEHAAAQALQRSLMPGRLPVVAGYDFATRYVPSATLGVGGDWYDVFELPGNRIGMVIGDVSGHGLASAVVMGRLRSALRAYALDNESPSVVLDKLDRKAYHFEAGAMATVAYGTIDLDRHQLRFCLAGHLPPVIAVPGQPSRFVDAAADPPIGFDLRTRQRRCHTVDLPAGALVCFYTDGLIERPGQLIDNGMQALLRIVSPDRADTVGAALMARFVGTASLGDDVAVLIAHRANA